MSEKKQTRPLLNRGAELVAVSPGIAMLQMEPCARREHGHEEQEVLETLAEGLA